MEPHNSNQSGTSPRPTDCETGGEILEDGSLIEIIEDLQQPGGLSLLKFDGTKSVLSPAVMHQDRTYIPLSLHSSIRQQLLLPAHPRVYGSIARLSEELLAVVARFTDLAEHIRRQLVAIVIATWCADLLPTPVNVWLWAPFAADGARVLELLRPLCRMALLIAGCTVADLQGLPSLLPASPLILLPASGRRMIEWLAASGWRDFSHVRSGRLVRNSGVRVISAGSPLEKFSAGSFIQVPILSSSRPLPPLDQTCQRELAQEFLPQLLQVRLDFCGRRIAEPGDANSERPDDWFSGRLCSDFVDAPELREHLGLLTEAESELEETHQADPRVVLLEGLRARCHERDRTEIHVAEIAADLNAALHSKGAAATMSARLVGSLLKEIGLPTHRLGRSGRGLKLDLATRRAVHRLAEGYNVPENTPYPGCNECAASQTIRK
jgi:hypothetical protein